MMIEPLNRVAFCYARNLFEFNATKIQAFTHFTIIRGTFAMFEVEIRSIKNILRTSQKQLQKCPSPEQNHLDLTVMCTFLRVLYQLHHDE